MGGWGASRATLAGVTGTVTNTRRPLPESNQAAAAECHRCAPARASPRTIPPIPQERSARLISRPRPRRGLSPAQYSAPNLAGAAGDEGAAHKPPRRARPLSRCVAAMASRCRRSAMAGPARTGSVRGSALCFSLLDASVLQVARCSEPRWVSRTPVPVMTRPRRRVSARRVFSKPVFRQLSRLRRQLEFIEPTLLTRVPTAKPEDRVTTTSH